MRRRKALLTALIAAVTASIIAGAFIISLEHPISTGDKNPATAALQFPGGHRAQAIQLLATQATSSAPHLQSPKLTSPAPPPDSVLLPDWEVLVLLPPVRVDANTTTTALSCFFPDGSSSPASSSGRSAFRCQIPPSVRILNPLPAPFLSSSAAVPPPQLLRWDWLVYESLSTEHDVIVFAKGINRRQGKNRPAADLRCVFLSGAGAAAAHTPVTSSVQEVFRCPHPPITAAELRVSLEIRAPGSPNFTTTMPSVAAYTPAPAPASDGTLICACTMVHNVAKFLREWVTYHSAVGVDLFVLYDNGSDDGLDAEAARLGGVEVAAWPWPKTQEAGFSHCAAALRGRCSWAAFIDVDEFVFASRWSNFSLPIRDMLPSLLPKAGAGVGQVSVSCRDFGPSGQRAHPSGGVTQGYDCRARAEERHKSLVFLPAVAASLENAVHHFELRRGWKGRKVRWPAAVVNHYKYQAWPEFRRKFRRRVSAYVADWGKAEGMRSRDRTPGLGTQPVEPSDWGRRFCEVKDVTLRDVMRRWFLEGDGRLSSRGSSGHPVVSLPMQLSAV